MVDAADSKSVAFTGVLVQVRPGAPTTKEFADRKINGGLSPPLNISMLARLALSESYHSFCVFHD
jgi:hypothetical protein